jgi:DNA-binding beta-propeller fold protein YncE
MSRFVRSVDLPRALELSGRGTPGDGLEIVGAVRDADGRQYVLDRRRARVIVLDAGGMPINAWGERGLHSGHFRDPSAIAMSIDRRTIFIADAWHPMVSAYTLDGRHLWTWAGAGADRPLRRPCAISAGRDGLVYVADSAADTVFVLSEAGAYVRRLGDTGVDNAQFWAPSGVAQAASGRLYVLDYGNHRVQGFDADGRWLVTFGVSRSVTRDQLEQMGRPAP